MVLSDKYKLGNNSIGQIFTPEYIAEFMVKNVQIFVRVSTYKEVFRVLEPCVGEGVFLKFLLRDQFKNITAYEIDKSLGTKLSELYPEINFRFDNFLGSNPEEKYDIIIGNPPYLGQNYNAKFFQDLIKNFPDNKKFFVGNMDLFYFFIHLGILKLVPGGLLSFITTNYWITKSKKTGIRLLKPHILNECFIVQYIDLSFLKIFKNAPGQHNCIFVLQKKMEREKAQKVDRPIEIIQIMKNEREENEEFKKSIFKKIINKESSPYIKRYFSSLTNRSLSEKGNWNLLYPPEIKQVVDKISSYCKLNNHLSVLKNLFIIRNGIILIKDEIFILKLNQNIKEEDNEFWIKIDNCYYKLNKQEKHRLKKIYKSKSIKAYGYNKSDFAGYLIFFNRNEFDSREEPDINNLYEKKFPNLIHYLKNYEKKLKQILINAKENPKDIFFPRRGHSIIISDDLESQKSIDLEPLYDKGKKIFFKFISKSNIFGYSNEQYYATSDTYFLWPKKIDEEIDYLFLLAYLNSKIVHFLFKAKNISIKRSKTRLEDDLMIPNLVLFKSKKQQSMITLIKALTEYIIEGKDLNQERLNDFQQRIQKNYLFHANKYSGLLKYILSAVTNHDIKSLQNSIDFFLFELFDLDEKEVDYLINKYY